MQGRIEAMSCELIGLKDSGIQKVIQAYESVFQNKEGVLYDVLSRINAIEEAKQILNMIFNGTQVKITCSLKDQIDKDAISDLIVNIGNAYCPETREHGKMECTSIQILSKKDEQHLLITYSCMHPICRAKRIKRTIEKNLPKLWDDAKEIAKSLRFFNIDISQKE